MKKNRMVYSRLTAAQLAEIRKQADRKESTITELILSRVLKAKIYGIEIDFRSVENEYLKEDETEISKLCDRLRKSLMKETSDMESFFIELNSVLERTENDLKNDLKVLNHFYADNFLNAERLGFSYIVSYIPLKKIDDISVSAIISRTYTGERTMKNKNISLRLDEETLIKLQKKADDLGVTTHNLIALFALGGDGYVLDYEPVIEFQKRTSGLWRQMVDLYLLMKMYSEDNAEMSAEMIVLISDVRELLKSEAAVIKTVGRRVSSYSVYLKESTGWVPSENERIGYVLSDMEDNRSPENMNKEKEEE